MDLEPDQAKARIPAPPGPDGHRLVKGTGRDLERGAVKRERGVLFVMPTPRYAPAGVVASWIVLAGWAAAAEEMWGHAWIRAPEGVLSSRDVTSQTPVPYGGRRATRSDRGSIRTIAATARYDLRQWMKARRFKGAALSGPWMTSDVAFVWQRHDVFHTAGFEASRALAKPLVLYVDAPLVWEKAKCGLRRPGWGKLVETLGERPQFRSADLLACVSEEVAEEVAKRGAREDRILVTPNGVDLDLFRPVASDGIRDALGLRERFVVGWAGTFRPFHAVEMALEAVVAVRDSIPDLALLLIGDGRERPRIEEQARRMGITEIVFTGTVPHLEMPRYLGAMDVALLLDEGRGSFHYSPLKLREYMACARAIVAPRVSDVAHLVEDGEQGLLVPAGDVHALASAIEQLHKSPELRRALGSAARETIMREGPWRRQVERVWAALEARAR